MANLLGNEHSPYLLQHQHNPVHWQPWGPDALEKAVSTNKLIIVSIGYSTCHWCHVMERESFENQAVADLMNQHFVNIKVDREERPDIDQIYMLAVQLMTGRGGWPLNCICLPDGRPIYGGTYFPKNDWMHLLQQLQTMWEENPKMALEYADKLVEGIRLSDGLPVETLPGALNKAMLEDLVRAWSNQFDSQHGGLQRAPKFPMPNNWDFLLQYAVLAKDSAVLDQVHLTLKKMAAGGIYDHVGGGFARYSVDERWHVPHFEKMLYDNAQLVSLYLAAWQNRPDPQYRRTIVETLQWVQREMTGENGGFYCALDADSEGVEGKFYTFQLEEIEALEDPEYGLDKGAIALLISHFNLTRSGNWAEESTNVLYQDSDADELAASEGFSEEEWDETLLEMKSALLAYREKRVRPGLDNKQLTSWNALMLKAFAEAYRVLNQPEYLEVALRNAAFIRQELYAENGGLLHQPADSNRQIPGFLDDYAFCIEAWIALYEATFDEQWLLEAKRLTDYVFDHFLDKNEGVFFYTADEVDPLITRKSELMDNVMPSSNSAMFRAIHKLGVIFDLPDYQKMTETILQRLVPQLQKYGSAYSNWAILLLHEVFGRYELIFSGNEAGNFRKQIDQLYIPNKMVFGGVKSELPLLAGRLSSKTQAFVCQNRTCSLPVSDVDELVKQL